MTSLQAALEEIEASIQDREKSAVAPDDDLTVEEWELAKAAAMLSVADRLDKPDEFLAYVRTKIANI